MQMIIPEQTERKDYDAQNTARAGGGHFMAIINK